MPFRVTSPDVIQAAGVIMLPEQAEGPGIALPSAADKVCFMYLLDDSGTAEQSTASQPNGSTSLAESTGQLNLNASAPTSKQSCSLLVFCQLEMQPERATSWVRGLLQVVLAQHVLVIASLPVSLPLHVPHNTTLSTCNEDIVATKYVSRGTQLLKLSLQCFCVCDTGTLLAKLLGMRYRKYVQCEAASMCNVKQQVCAVRALKPNNSLIIMPCRPSATEGREIPARRLCTMCCTPPLQSSSLSLAEFPACHQGA